MCRAVVVGRWARGRLFTYRPADAHAPKRRKTPWSFATSGPARSTSLVRSSNLDLSEMANFIMISDDARISAELTLENW